MPITRQPLPISKQEKKRKNRAHIFHACSSRSTSPWLHHRYTSPKFASYARLADVGTRGWLYRSASARTRLHRDYAAACMIGIGRKKDADEQYIYIIGDIDRMYRPKVPGVCA